MRPAPRLYVDDALGDGPVLLSQEHSRYLGQVLRLEAGGEVRLFNGRDGEWTYVLTSTGKRGGEASPKQQRREAPVARNAPHLFFAPIKRTQTELLVQKATELGVVSLQPVITARTNRDQIRLDRFASIATEAAEQSERLDLPSVHQPVLIAKMLEDPMPFIFCDEAGDKGGEPWGGVDGRAPMASSVFPAMQERPRAILIGPEGGFTPEERTAIRALDHATPVSLGPRILRAETAAIVALTLWQAAFGDLNSNSS